VDKGRQEKEELKKITEKEVQINIFEIKDLNLTRI
jgi:hypothetical protein